MAHKKTTSYTSFKQKKWPYFQNISLILFVAERSTEFSQ